MREMKQERPQVEGADEAVLHSEARVVSAKQPQRLPLTWRWLLSRLLAPLIGQPCRLLCYLLRLACPQRHLVSTTLATGYRRQRRRLFARSAVILALLTLLAGPTSPLVTSGSGIAQAHGALTSLGASGHWTRDQGKPNRFDAKQDTASVAHARDAGQERCRWYRCDAPSDHAWRRPNAGWPARAHASRWPLRSSAVTVASKLTCPWALSPLRISQRLAARSTCASPRSRRAQGRARAAAGSSPSEPI